MTNQRHNIYCGLIALCFGAFLFAGSNGKGVGAIYGSVVAVGGVCLIGNSGKKSPLDN